MDAIVSRLLDIAELEELPATPKDGAAATPKKPQLEDFSGDVSPVRKLHVHFLGSGGSGTGRGVNWAVHAMTISPLNAGRLKRGPRKFLCSTKDGWGCEGVAGEEPVSCPECLSRIERYGLSVCEDPRIADLLTAY